MSLFLKLNSRELISQGKITDPSEFSLNLDQALNLGSLNYKIGVYSIDCWNTAKNVVNETLRYSINASYYTWTIPDGNYSIELLNQAFQVDIVSNGGTTGMMQLIGDPSQNKALVVIDNTSDTYTLDLATSTGIANLLGFPELEVVTSGTAPNIANFSRNPINYDSIDSWQLDTNLITGSYENGANSRVCYSFVPTGSVSSKFIEKPVNIPYFQISQTTLSNIYLSLRDNRGNKIDLGGEHLNVVFEIKPI